MRVSNQFMVNPEIDRLESHSTLFIRDNKYGLNILRLLFLIQYSYLHYVLNILEGGFLVYPRYQVMFKIKRFRIGI